MTKSISGIYLDNQNFTHNIFYSDKMWIETIVNPDGKYCSHNHYTKEQVVKHLSGMNKGFEYLGLVFYPYLRLYGKDGKFENMSKRINNDFVLDGYNYDDFYKTAQTKSFDLFLCNGKVLIPASRCLFEYNLSGV